MNKRLIRLFSISIILVLAFGSVLSSSWAQSRHFALGACNEYREEFVQPNSLKNIMYGLIYPAVLGSGLVLFISHVARDIWHHQTTQAPLLQDLTIYPAITAGLFYILSFSEVTETAEERATLSYQWLPFLVDWIEVALMFGCFYLLQLIDEHLPPDGPHLLPAYGCLLADVIVVQPIWRLVAGVNPWIAFRERAIVAAFLALGMIAVDYPKLHPWVDLLIALVAFLFVFLYVYRDVKYQRE